MAATMNTGSAITFWQPSKTHPIVILSEVVVEDVAVLLRADMGTQVLGDLCDCRVISSYTPVSCPWFLKRHRSALFLYYAGHYQEDYRECCLIHIA